MSRFDLGQETKLFVEPTDLILDKKEHEYLIRVIAQLQAKLIHLSLPDIAGSLGGVRSILETLHKFGESQQSEGAS